MNSIYGLLYGYVVSTNNNIFLCFLYLSTFGVVLKQFVGLTGYIDVIPPPSTPAVHKRCIAYKPNELRTELMCLQNVNTNVNIAHYFLRLLSIDLIKKIRMFLKSQQNLEFVFLRFDNIFNTMCVFCNWCVHTQALHGRSHFDSVSYR